MEAIISKKVKNMLKDECTRKLITDVIFNTCTHNLILWDNKKYVIQKVK